MHNMQERKINGNLCEFISFREALEKAINLLKKENLEKRGIKNITENVEKLRDFLTEIYNNDKLKNYDELAQFINLSENLQKYKEFIGFLGKILDAIQLLKPSKRRDFARSKLIENLQRTGHGFLINSELVYLQELVEASATFTLLEVVYAFNYESQTSKHKNPLATLRQSMGNRLPEEYFSELLAGWIIEDSFIQELRENKKIDVKLKSIDKERTILLVRATNMGEYDLSVALCNRECENYYFEIQRTGKIKQKQSKKYIIPLKAHKYNRGDSDNKIILLWFGRNIPDLPKKYSFLENKLIFIRHIKQNKDFSFCKENNQDYLSFSNLKTLTNRSISWEDFKQMNKDQFIDYIKKLN